MQFIFPPDQFPGPGKWLSCPLAVHQVTCLLWRSSPPSSSFWDSRVGLPWALIKVNISMLWTGQKPPIYNLCSSFRFSFKVFKVDWEVWWQGPGSEEDGPQSSYLHPSQVILKPCVKWVISLLFRARPSGGVLSVSSSSDLASLRELEKELLLTENIRNIRDNEVESENIYSVSSLQGLLPHQKRQSAPYYGRRRRHAEAAERPSLGWTILDPVTGREIAAWVQ